MVSAITVAGPRAAARRVACVGGGPGGLFAAIAIAHWIPGATVEVFERNKATDVFGFGVVFSDATLDNIDQVDPVLRDTLRAEGTHWDRIEVHAHGQTMSAGGNGMSAIHRRVLLDALRARAEALGAHLRFNTPVDADELAGSGDYDLIIAADGANSATRERYCADLGHSVDQAAVKFIWFATTFEFNGLTFLHEQSEHGNFAVHGYPIGSGLSTFIVETDEPAWRAAGLDGFDVSIPPGHSDEVSRRYLENLFADDIAGHPLVANNSRWDNFCTRRTRRWHTMTAAGVPLVLIGDAVHTAHFSVGSGTKMAMEDAAALAQALANHPFDVGTACEEFENVRHPQVAHVQNSSLPSLSWWDHFGEYYSALPPWQFGFHFFSRAISARKIARRDPAYVAAAEQAWYGEHGAAPLDTPFTIGTTEFRTRLLTVEGIDEGGTFRIGDGTNSLAVSDRFCDGEAALFTAPGIETTSLSADTTAQLDELCSGHPAAVAVRAGTALSRALAAEHLRLRHGTAVIVIDSPAALRSRRAVDERDNAATMVLSGRADAVAYEPDSQLAKAHQ
jgi:anthraniloyl-CoA monooxygenase